MKKTLIFIIICILTVSLCSCSNDKYSFTDTEAAQYLSEIDGLVPIGDSEYEISCGEYTLYAGTSLFFIENARANNHIRYTGMSMYNLLCVEAPEEYYDEYYSYTLEMEPMVPSNSKYLHGGNRSSNLAYLLEEYGIKSTPEWHEWIDYEVASSIDASPHGKANAYWYNPVTETYEKGVYIKDNDVSTEIYVVYHDVSLLAMRTGGYVVPYLMSEKLFNEIQTEVPDSKSYEYFAKGSIEKVATWFMGEYLEEVPDFFAGIKEEVYYPLKAFPYTEVNKYLEKHGYDAVELYLSDMEALGVNFDKITAQIIKVTVPHDGTLEDITWELISE
ncbi:MAG: hypothetical protein IJN12_01535 [Clostridia bacterium]|nr:hypothetical protein [Clostridia bacterium]